jgi:hypothetical protein
VALSDSGDDVGIDISIPRWNTVVIARVEVNRRDPEGHGGRNVVRDLGR